jgi:DNA-binding MarR family transcriptional regulator
MAPSAPRFDEQTPQARLLRELIRYSARIRRDSDRYFARFGISGAQWGAMRTLHRAESHRRSGLRLGELGEQMLVRPPSMTTVVDRLERIGYVQKRPCSDDRRGKEVSLTSQGRDLVERILRGQQGRVQQVVGGLDENESRLLLALLERLSSRLAPDGTPNEEHRA